MDYAPETTMDPSFTGIAVGCGVVCRVHNLEPHKRVAFEGSDTGRRFLMCQVENVSSSVHLLRLRRRRQHLSPWGRGGKSARD
jgi:hypothetical protein